VRPIAIGFDFDHTLGVDNKLEQVAFVRVIRRVAGDNRALDIYRGTGAFDREIALYRAGKCSLEEAFTSAAESALGVTAPAGAFDAFRQQAVSLVPEYVRAIPGVAELLRGLDASSVPYALLTNGWNPLQQRKADFIGFTKPVFVSDDLGVRKPNVRAFNVLRDSFALDAELIWYVGDDPLVDIVGALGSGMRAIWFDGEMRKYPTNIPAPTAIVHNLADTLAVIL
jgi:FMN phosphatase YigB (HAD superfamily)